jgi:protein involved in polysaccharide export with SLBB domain
MNIRAAILVAPLLVAGVGPRLAPAVAQSSKSVASDSLQRGDLLRPGDIIKLNVWREPEWSGEYAVDEAGVAVLPRIGGVRVTSMSPDSLRRFLVDSLGRFLRNPSIEVVQLRRVQILGAVRNPGLYPVPPTVSVGDAVALAGGATPDGKADKVVLRRNGERLSINLTKDTPLADTPIRTGDELFVPQRSWVSRNTGLVAAGLSAATSVVLALMFAGK